MRQLIFSLVTLSLFTLGVTQAQTLSHSAYLPLVVRPAAPPTPTSTTTPTRPPTASPTSTATATQGPTATPTLPPASYNNCQADPNPGAAPNYPVRIVIVNKSASPESVVLQNLSGQAIDLTGWHMCSVTGNQQHPITGVLGAGQTQTYYGAAGTFIWNNSTSDPGALYNAAGQLVSAWPD